MRRIIKFTFIAFVVSLLINAALFAALSTVPPKAVAADWVYHSVWYSSIGLWCPQGVEYGVLADQPGYWKVRRQFVRPDGSVYTSSTIDYGFLNAGQGMYGSVGPRTIEGRVGWWRSRVTVYLYGNVNSQSTIYFEVQNRGC